MARKQTRNKGRFTKKNSRRRRGKAPISVTNVGVQLAVANAVTMGLFNTNLSDFFTGRRDGKYVAGFDGAQRLTLPELLGAGSLALGGTYAGKGETPHASYDGLAATLKTNLMSNGPMMAAQVIMIPVGVKMAKKFLAKPLINPANKIIRSVGIKEVKI